MHAIEQSHNSDGTLMAWFIGLILATTMLWAGYSDAAGQAHRERALEWCRAEGHWIVEAYYMPRLGLSYEEGCLRAYDER
ncbi:MAG TPA: hypothetical protein VH723_02505 [Candidatus Limnocylindrales bacterium]